MGHSRIDAEVSDMETETFTFDFMLIIYILRLTENGVHWICAKKESGQTELRLNLKLAEKKIAN